MPAAPFVDPRRSPSPGDAIPERPIATASSGIAALLPLCRAGRIYAIEQWISEGKPIQSASYATRPRRPRLDTPMEVAVESGLFDVAHLLLCNGYRLDHEPSDHHEGLLDRLLRRRDWVMLDLLVEWGADITKLAPDTIFDTYDTDFIERCWQAGLDLTKRQALARYLSEHSSNRPLYGWARRHRDDPRIQRALNSALVQAVYSSKEKIVHLLVWAGADPRAKAPLLEYSRGEDDPDDSCESAMETAAGGESGDMLRILKPRPELDDFDALYATVRDVGTIKYLLKLQRPRDWNAAILHNISWLSWGFRDSSASRACLDLIAAEGGRLGVLSPQASKGLRNHLLKFENTSDLKALLRWLSDPANCDATTFAELTRAPALRAKMHELMLPVPGGRPSRR